MAYPYTGRTRPCTVAGSGLNLAPSYFGRLPTARVANAVLSSAQRDNPASPGHLQTQWTLDLTLTIASPYEGIGVGGATFTVSASTAWTDYEPADYDYTLTTNDLTLTFSDVSTLKELWPGTGEARILTSYGVAATFTYAVLILPGTLAIPLGTSVSGSYSFTGDPDDDVGLGSQAGHDDYGVRWLLAAPGSGSGSVTVTCAGLDYPTDAIAAGGGSGSYTLTGTPLSIVFDSDAASIQTVLVRVCPDWQYTVTSEDLDYETGDPIPVEINHWGDPGPFGGTPGYVLRGTFTSPGPYSFGDRGKLIVSSTFFGPLAGEGTWGTFLGGEQTNQFEPDEAWGDAFATLIDSGNYAYPGGARRYRFRTASDDEAGRITFTDEHAFQTFATAGAWSAYTDPAFLSLNPTYGAGTISAGLAFAAAGPGVFRRTGNLKNFSYRWLRLRVKSSVAGYSFRFCLGNTFTDPVAPRYAWTVTIAEEDTWQDVVLDMGHPDEVNATAALSWDVNRALLHLDGWGPPSWAGAAVWLDLPAAGSIEVESLTGYYRTDGDRTPLRAQYPLETAGSVNGDVRSYDLPNPPVAPVVPFLHQLARFVVNGLRSLYLGTTFDTTEDPDGAHAGLNPWIYDYWSQGLFPLLDSAANDTGVTVEFSDNDMSRHTLHALPAYNLTLPIEKQEFPDLPIIFRALVKPVGLFGYYGMGTPGGAYDSILSLVCERVWNGELLGQVHEDGVSQPGVTVALYDDDTGVLVDSAATDADGLYRLFRPYGVVTAYSNLPRGGSAGARAQGSPGSYTAQGLLLNASWAKGEALHEAKDGSGYLLASGVRAHFPVSDRFPSWYDFGGSVLRGVDLYQSATTWVFRSERDGTAAKVERTLDAGVSWQGGAVATDASPTALPTLAGDRESEQHESIWLWYHTAGGDVRAWLSDDLGDTWQDWGTLAGLGRFPRAALTLDRFYLVAHDGTNLNLYTSDDFGKTLAGLTLVVALAMPEQLVGLAVDRRQTLRLYYRDAAGTLQHRELDGTAWSSATALTTGQHPGVGLGIERGLVGYFDGGSLRLRFLDETYAAVGATAVAPVGTWESGPPGVLVDHREGNWVAGWQAGAVAVRESADGATWQAPV